MSNSYVRQSNLRIKKKLSKIKIIKNYEIKKIIFSEIYDS
jgi:hypothetical protein